MCAIETWKETKSTSKKSIFWVLLFFVKDIGIKVVELWLTKETKSASKTPPPPPPPPPVKDVGIRVAELWPQQTAGGSQDVGRHSVCGTTVEPWRGGLWSAESSSLRLVRGQGCALIAGLVRFKETNVFVETVWVCACARVRACMRVCLCLRACVFHCVCQSVCLSVCLSVCPSQAIPRKLLKTSSNLAW